LGPVFDWFLRALRVRMNRSGETDETEH